MDIRELYWVAGFLEGEGSFGDAAGGGRVTAWQVQRQPLDRLQAFCGGSIRYIRRRTAKPTHKDVHHWWVTGPTARGLMMTLYPLMSPKRQGQIVKALARWHSIHQQARGTHCPQGHAYTVENTTVYGNGYRKCRTCARRMQARYIVKVKASRQDEYGAVLEQQRDWTATHCRRGHERTPENTYTVPQTGRTMCRLCRQENKRAYRARTSMARPHHPVTQCSKGHAYTEENTYIIPSTGARMCKTCNRERAAAWRATQAACS